MSARLTFDGLVVSYPAAGGLSLPAVGAIDMMIEPGSFVALVGPSGSGKSTLLRVIAGLLKPSAGTVWLDDQVITRPDKRVAMMFQDANLMPWRTVIDNVALPLELTGVGKEERSRAARRLLPQLGLEEYPEAYPGELSGGMAQRVALGRVLIQRPDVLLLDEPFGALDAMTRERISQDLVNLWMQERQTVVMVTHDINEAVLLSDRVIVLLQRPGRIVADCRVPLERPRTLDVMYSTAFGETAHAVRAAIK